MLAVDIPLFGEDEPKRLIQARSSGVAVHYAQINIPRAVFPVSYTHLTLPTT